MAYHKTAHALYRAFNIEIKFVAKRLLNTIFNTNITTLCEQMNQQFQNLILQSTQAQSLDQTELLQSLWSGYGSIVRYGLKGGQVDSVVVKHVDLSGQNSHPRGWNTDISHQRKLRSYQVETTWYSQWSQHCDDTCRIPKCFAFQDFGNEIIIVLEDLDTSGFPIRKSYVTHSEIRVCLAWLASFHATFLGKSPHGLWPIGTYWHLNTRPDELAALTDYDLKNAADKIDRKLNFSPFQTIVHGDAKLANFNFSSDGKRVSAVDFQYVGGGCGIKDVAYFIGSCLDENQCHQSADALLDFYFNSLKSALKSRNKTIDANLVEQNWRELFPFAWTDFHRFIKGWSPGHWKINGYSEQMSRRVLASLNQQD